MPTDPTCKAKKHREREAAYGSAESAKRQEPEVSASSSRIEDQDESESEDQAASDEDEASDIEDRLAASRRRRFLTSDCLFCPKRSTTTEESLKHMTSIHSFFIPDRELLVDLPGLLAYLGEKVLIGNICLYCPGGAKEFSNLESVRNHMIDKGHCKIAFDSDEDRAELADFFNFEVIDDDEAWEDLDEDGDQGMEERPRPVESGVTLGNDGLSLVLPSGRVLGHRALRVYYAQKLRPIGNGTTAGDLTVSKIARVKERLADPTQALIPVAGGAGGYGRGLEVMKARNAGEAKWAKKQAQGFHDQKARQLHKTKMGFKHNNQKHFRDPLLQ